MRSSVKYLPVRLPVGSSSEAGGKKKLKISLFPQSSEVRGSWSEVKLTVISIKNFFKDCFSDPYNYYHVLS
jgi:hypothetical protein